MPQPQENYLDRLKAIRQKYGCPTQPASQFYPSDPKGYSGLSYNKSISRLQSADSRDRSKSNFRFMRIEDNPESGKVSSLSRRRSIVELPLQVEKMKEIEKIREIQRIKDSYSQNYPQTFYGTPERRSTYGERPSSSLKSSIPLKEYESSAIAEMKASTNLRQIEMKKIQELDDRICEKERLLRARAQGNEHVMRQINNCGLKDYRLGSKQPEIDRRSSSSYKQLDYAKNYQENREKFTETKPLYNEVKMSLGENKFNYPSETRLNYMQKITYPESKVCYTESKLNYPQSKLNYPQSKLNYPESKFNHHDLKTNYQKKTLQDRQNRPMSYLKQGEVKAMSPVRLLDRKDDGWNMSHLDKIQQRIQSMLHRK